MSRKRRRSGGAGAPAPAPRTRRSASATVTPGRRAATVEAARQVQVQPLAMDDEEGRPARLADAGQAHDLFEAVLENGDQHRRRERRDRIGQHLADVGPGELLDARIERGLAVDGDRARLQQHGAVRADRPLDVLGRAEAGPPPFAPGPRPRAARAPSSAAPLRPVADRSAPVSRSSTSRRGRTRPETRASPRPGVRLHDQDGGVARVAGEDDAGRARLHEPLDEDGDDRPRRPETPRSVRISAGGGRAARGGRASGDLGVAPRTSSSVRNWPAKLASAESSAADDERTATVPRRR